jgi:hypothetical protein
MNLSTSFTPVADSQLLSGITSSTPLKVPKTATCAVMSAIGSTVSMRDDGQAATATAGIQIVPESIFEYSGDLSKVQVYSDTGALFVAYYKVTEAALAKSSATGRRKGS